MEEPGDANLIHVQMARKSSEKLCPEVSRSSFSRNVSTECQGSSERGRIFEDLWELHVERSAQETLSSMSEGKVEREESRSNQDSSRSSFGKNQSAAHPDSNTHVPAFEDTRELESNEQETLSSMPEVQVKLEESRDNQDSSHSPFGKNQSTEHQGSSLHGRVFEDHWELESNAQETQSPMQGLQVELEESRDYQDDDLGLPELLEEGDTTFESYFSDDFDSIPLKPEPIIISGEEGRRVIRQLDNKFNALKWLEPWSNKSVLCELCNCDVSRSSRESLEQHLFHHMPDKRNIPRNLSTGKYRTRLQSNIERSWRKETLLTLEKCFGHHLRKSRSTGLQSEKDGQSPRKYPKGRKPRGRRKNLLRSRKKAQEELVDLSAIDCVELSAIVLIELD